MSSAPLATPATATADAPGSVMVEVHDLVKRYGRTVAVNGVSLSIRRGEIFGLLGPNGAGKTTTLEMIEGIRASDAGTIRVDGLDVRKRSRAVRQRIGVQLQATTLFEELTVRETLALFGAFYPHALAPAALLRDVALEDKARAYPQDLSGGQRQRLALALALVNDPPLLFLDEPTAGLDPQSRRMLWDTILALRARGKTVVLTTHFMDEAQLLCDRIAILDGGQIIAQDTPAGLVSLLGASATIECSLTTLDARPGAAQPAIALDELSGLPGVTAARQGLEQTLLYSDDTERTLVALLHLVAARGARLDHLQVHAPTLEDVFLKLTGRALRDA